LKLLLDNNLPPRLARSLNMLFDGCHHIVALREQFEANTADVDWATALDRDGGWAVLTRDLRIRTRPHERAVLDRSRVVFFFLAGAWNKFTVEETAARLIRLIRRWRRKRDSSPRSLRAPDQSGGEAEAASEVNCVAARQFSEESEGAIRRL
jgi:hypothetical protein